MIIVVTRFVTKTCVFTNDSVEMFPNRSILFTRTTYKYWFRFRSSVRSRSRFGSRYRSRVGSRVRSRLRFKFGSVVVRWGGRWGGTAGLWGFDMTVQLY